MKYFDLEPKLRLRNHMLYSKSVSHHVNFAHLKFEIYSDYLELESGLHQVSDESSEISKLIYPCFDRLLNTSSFKIRKLVTHPRLFSWPSRG